MPLLAETVTHQTVELYAVIGALSAVIVYLERQRVSAYKALHALAVRAAAALDNAEPEDKS